MLEPVDRARARDGLRLRRVHVGHGVGAGRACCAPTRTRAAASRRWRCSDLAALEQRLGTMSLAARARLPGLDARRADTIYAGAVVFRTVLEMAGADEATLCETALREGIIADYVATNRPGILLVDEFPDLRRRTVMELARRCQFREDHGTHVARLALSIFDQTRRLHKLADRRRRAAGVRGAAARHRLLHLAAPPPPPQRVPDPEPRDDRIFAGRGPRSSRWPRATTARSSRGGAGA